MQDGLDTQGLSKYKHRILMVYSILENHFLISFALAVFSAFM